jgi:trans-aconitate 2-methyltransferase
VPTWDANLYLQFANERARPALDLITRINVSRPTRIMDLGCGPGNSTAMLRHRWPEASITGLDNSVEMIAAAAQAYPTEKWVLADAAAWTADAPYDIVFSNATLQWLPDHAILFPHLMAQLTPAGLLAVQMPYHYESPLHQVVLEVANAVSWRHRMEAPRTALTKEPPSLYYDVLQPLTSHLDLWETEYFHILDSPQSIVDWYRGTGLRPFLEALETEEQKQQFERMVLHGYTRAYPRQKDGRVLFPFRRLFIVAHR